MNNFVEQRQGPPMIMDEIPRTYYPGRGFLTDQEAYPTDMNGWERKLDRGVLHEDVLADQENARQARFLLDNLSRFNPPPRYSGGMNVPGAPGNLQTLPYQGGPLNPTPMPYYPGQDYGGVELLAGGFRPASYGAIRGGQTPYRFGPYLPYRGEERKEEETPFIPIPLQQAQGLPMGFQNKYVS